MDQPVDPRLNEKNFGMPMPPGGFPEPGENMVRRKEFDADREPRKTNYGPENPDIPPGVEIRPRVLNDQPPLFGTLFRRPGGTYKVTITDGKLIEVIPRKRDADDDGVVEQTIDGIWDGTLLKEHGILLTQFIGVYGTCDEEGYVDPASLIISVRDHDYVTTHYQPPVGQDAGQPGFFFYELYQLLGTPPNEYLKVLGGGSNVGYVHDTPPFKWQEGASGADIYNKYNLVKGCYEYKGFEGQLPISVAQNPDNPANILVKLTGVVDHDLTVRFFKLVAGTPINVPINIPSLTVQGTINSAGAHTHTETAHTHPLDLHHHAQYGGGQTGNGITGTSGEFLVTGTSGEFLVTGSGGGSTTGSSGDHTHTFTMTTVAVTTDSPTVRPTVSIPGLPVLEIDGAAGTIVYCWRKGTLAGVFVNGVGKPALPGGGSTSEWAVMKTAGY